MGIAIEETKLKKIDGVQVYARKNDAGKPAEIDAIDLDKSKIDADRRGAVPARLRRDAPAQGEGRQGPLPAQGDLGRDGQPPDDPFEGL